VATFVLHLPAAPIAPSHARQFLRAVLGAAELNGVGEITELLTTELVTNSIVHAGSPTTLRLDVEASRLHVEVDDLSSTPPVVRPTGPRDPSGHGLQLVDHLSSRWGCESRTDGKTVWFEIDTPVEIRGV
jgi:anti-sigma regulatory factor (Ser/Thr protein kinase)